MERGPGNKVARTRAKATDRKTLVLEPDLVIEHRHREETSSRECRGQGGSGIPRVQPSLRLRDQLRSGGEVEPVDVERVAGIAVGDTRRSEHAAQPAHDHGDLRPGITRLFRVGPEHRGDAIGAHRHSRCDCQEAKRRACLAASEVVLAQSLDTKRADDVHAQWPGSSAHGS